MSDALYEILSKFEQDLVDAGDYKQLAYDEAVLRIVLLFNTEMLKCDRT